jgi:hypothetical protein
MEKFINAAIMITYLTNVPMESPFTIWARLPGLFMSNTIIGRAFS